MAREIMGIMTSKEYKIKDGKEQIIRTEIEINLLRKQLDAKGKELDNKYDERNGMTKAVKFWEAELLKENQSTTNQSITK